MDEIRGQQGDRFDVSWTTVESYGAFPCSPGTGQTGSSPTCACKVGFAVTCSPWVCAGLNAQLVIDCVNDSLPRAKDTALVVSTERCPSRNWICSSSPPVGVAKPCTSASKVVRSHVLDGSLPGGLAHDPPLHLLAMPEPQTVPLWVTQRKMCPSAIRATASHSSTASFTQPGTGTVRTWPPLPKRSMMAQ